MALFSYKVIDAAGKEIKGSLEGESSSAVMMKLQANGMYIVEIKKKSTSDKGGIDSFANIKNIFRNRVSLPEISAMTRLLATLQKAKIPLDESINAVAIQQENPYLKEVMLIVKDRIREGYSFSKSAREFPKVFDDLFCNMVAAGEKSGATDKVLLRLADFMESQVDLKNKVKGAMTYPLVLMGVAVLVVGVLFTVVIPKLAKMFEDIDMALPFQTRVLIWLSGFIGSWWWLIIIVGVGGYYFFSRYIKTEPGELWWSRVQLTMPQFGKVNRMVAISRFSKTLSTLLTAGVPILTAFDIVEQVIGNKILADAVHAARENIKEGESIAVPLKRSGEFPPIVTQMIAIGEQSGELEEMLETLADSYEKEVRYILDRLTALLEPIMIIALAVVVGFIVFAVVLPILQINDAVG
ncbi:type II secretion system inner membrane protein GspF [bacterium]|nr:type II secretion system inner membrane protein GspF [bacterium]